VSFVDEYSRMMWIYFIKTKDKVLYVFQRFKLLVDKEQWDWESTSVQHPSLFIFQDTDYDEDTLSLPQSNQKSHMMSQK
jgi:hypothetical protein